ncbi:MAG: outer membrane beta-barrel domain-containing protein [Deltaproteobacteria bacterium]|nr:outer membrane beta-barrel domain-containing protein [Deltaproteobacteria bacterium]
MTTTTFSRSLFASKRRLGCLGLGLSSLAFLVLPASFGSLAYAEDAPPAGPEVAEVAEVADVAATTEQADRSETKPSEDAWTSAADSAFPRIADNEETIYAVQRKAYLLKGKLELTPLFTSSFSDRFVRALGPAASVTYHVAENFGLEAFGLFLFPSASGLTSEIFADGLLRPEVAKLTQMLWASGLGFQWSPVYGKMQIFGAPLGNFSFYVGAGAAVGMTRVRCEPTKALDPNRGFDPPVCPETSADVVDGKVEEVYEPNTLRVMASVAGGVRFYFSNTIGLKLEVRDYIFPARVYQPPEGEIASEQVFTDAIRNNIFINAGISFLIGGEEN